jgi:ParB family chromosome partitioning protein
VTGFTDPARAIDSIKVGQRIRESVGDISGLIDSLRATGGPIQPVTITGDGWLISGARRLEAARVMGLRTIPVWVRTGISTDVEILIAQWHENTHHLGLSLVDATRRYEELLVIAREDAARRQHATRFTADVAPGGGAGNLPTPGAAVLSGRAGDVAARIVGVSRRTLEKTSAVLAATSDPDPSVRSVAQAQQALLATRATGADPAFRAVQAARADAHAAAQRALAALRAAPTLDGAAPGAAPAAGEDARRRARPSGVTGVRVAPASPVKRGTRAFVLMLEATDFWWLYYDPARIAAALSPSQWEHATDWRLHTVEFLDRLFAHRPKEGK